MDGAKRISERSVFETTLLFEALFQDMIEQGCGQVTVLTVKAQKNFGEYTITLGFEGEAYIPSMKKDQKSISPDLQIVQAYSDKVGYRYRSGYNRVSIVVKRNHNSALIYCIIAIFSEVFFGWLQNIINVLGDVVTAAIEEQKARRQSAKVKSGGVI